MNDLHQNFNRRDFLKLSITVLIGLSILGAFLFLGGGENKKPDNGTQTHDNGTPGVTVINNQSGTMEGHVPRGFQGMGTGLFAGDNLNPGFPNNDGVQFFLTFDLSAISSDRIASATLRSNNMHVQGSPFEDLGALKAEAVRYDIFSSALWNLKPDGFACMFAVSPDGAVACTLTDAIQQTLNNKLRVAQFRVRFEKAGDGDGNPDLALFYKTESNKNETGIFQLEITADNETEELSTINLPVVLHLVKDSGVISTARSRDNVLALFQKSQAIWDQANIIFNVSATETVLNGGIQKAVQQENLREIYKILPNPDSALHIFFVSTLYGSNGVAIAPSLALVADKTTVNDFRAAAHELGHLLGLEHANTDRSRLLFRGANGTSLTTEEIARARSSAKQLQEL